MDIVLMRHAETEGNLKKQYIGITDEPLCREGIRHAVRSGIVAAVPLVYSSTSIRAVQTATIKFPYARMVLIPGLREMNFGVFERRSADDMENDLRYRAWVEGECYGECPHGEGRIGFSARICVAFSEIVGENLSRRRGAVIIVAHGGTIMAIMERFVRPRRDYFDWHVPPCGGYVVHLDDATWETNSVLSVVEKF
jgi:alpha-ribazole phosphatase